MQILPSTPRPADLRTVLLKHSMTEARDCELSWRVDFGAMEILLYAPIISPVLLLDFLTVLPRRDERFQQTGIVDAAQISTRFSIKLIVQSDGQDICFSVRIFRLRNGFGKETHYGLELL
jgi:hypothetical protein